jgi:hypothetical protein
MRTKNQADNPARQPVFCTVNYCTVKQSLLTSVQKSNLDDLVAVLYAIFPIGPFVFFIQMPQRCRSSLHDTAMLRFYSGVLLLRS